RTSDSVTAPRSYSSRNRDNSVTAILSLRRFAPASSRMESSNRSTNRSGRGPVSPIPPPFILYSSPEKAESLGSSLHLLRLAARPLAVARRRRRQPDFSILVRAESSSSRHQVAQDDVLLQAHQVIHLARQGRLRQHLGRLLEARGADEALRLHGRLGD